MINLMGVRAVQARIAQLQQQFGLPGPVPGMDFQKKLDKEMQRGGAAGAAAAGAAGKAAAQTPKEAVVHSAGSNGAANPFASYSVNSSLPVADQNLSSLIDAAARKYNVDPKLVSAVAEVESGGDQDAASSAGAVGVMQLMPDTAEWIAGKLRIDNYGFDMMEEPKYNVRFGCWYLNYLSTLFNGNPLCVVCAYHAGQGEIASWLANPLYSTDGVTLNADNLPEGPTKQYAGRVIRDYGIYQAKYFDQTVSDSAADNAANSR